MSLDIAGIGSVADFLKSAVDRIWPDKTKALEIKADIDKATLGGELAEHQAAWDNAKSQIAVNMEEAKSSNLFVAGWRPAVGWICCAIFAYNYIIYAFLKFALIVGGWSGDVAKLPELNIGEVMPVLLGILGLGMMRTHEKVKGAEGNR